MNYDKLLQEVITEAKQINIPISDFINTEIKINTRAKGRLGQCKKRQLKGFDIEIASFIEQTNIKNIKEILAHEVLHTCPNCFNHQLQWQIYANKMNKEYGYNIKRTGNAVAMGIIIPRQRNYVLICQKCDYEIVMERMCKTVKHPEKFRCLCGGRLVLQ